MDWEGVLSMSESLIASVGKSISPCARLSSPWPRLTTIPASLTLVGALTCKNSRVFGNTWRSRLVKVYSQEEEMLVCVRIERNPGEEVEQLSILNKVRRRKRGKGDGRIKHSRDTWQACRPGKNGIRLEQTKEQQEGKR